MVQNKIDMTPLIKAVKHVVKTISREAALIMRKDAMKNFDAGGFYGDTWVPRKKEYNHPILVDTKALKRAVADSMRTGGKTGPQTYTMRVVNDYGLFHNEGTGGMPKRQFIGHSPQLDEQVFKIITKKLEEKMKQG